MNKPLWGEKEKSLEILHNWFGDRTDLEIWKTYPKKLQELQDFLHPKVAKELLDAFLE